MMKMHVFMEDEKSGMKLGISKTEYNVFFYDTWHKINTKDRYEAERIFKKLCFDYAIDEARRLNQTIC